MSTFSKTLLSQEMSRRSGNWAVTTTGKKSGGAITSHETKYKSSYNDKQSGSYGRVTTKDSVSSGDYANRGKTGYKDDYKASTTVRLGDKSGYTEYSKEERVTRIKYDGNFGRSSRGIEGYNDSCGRSITSGIKGCSGGGGGGGGDDYSNGDASSFKDDMGSGCDYPSGDDDDDDDDGADDDGGTCDDASYDDGDVADNDSYDDGDAADNDSYDDGGADDNDSYDDGGADDNDSYDDDECW